METNFKFTLYLGLNDKDTKTQKINTLEAYKIVTNILQDNFNGATIYEALGLYKHDNGIRVEEKTLRIEILFAEESEIRDLVKLLKRVFNQESIAVQKEIVTSELW